MHLISHLNYFTGKKRSIASNETASPKTKALKSDSSIQLDNISSFSYKSKLNEVCQKMKIDSPSYSSVRTSGGFVCTVVLNGQGEELFLFFFLLRIVI